MAMSPFDGLRRAGRFITTPAYLFITLNLAYAQLLERSPRFLAADDIAAMRQKLESRDCHDDAHDDGAGAPLPPSTYADKPPLTLFTRRRDGHYLFSSLSRGAGR